MPNTEAMRGAVRKVHQPSGARASVPEAGGKCRPKAVLKENEPSVICQVTRLRTQAVKVMQPVPADCPWVLAAANAVSEIDRPGDEFGMMQFDESLF